MRIDGMDASVRPVISTTAAQARIEHPIKPAASTEEQENKLTQVDEAFIRRAVNRANETMQIHGRALEFRIHEKTNEIIVKIIDTETNEIIREIPSEKILDMFANMLELAGLLVDERR